MMMPPCAYGLVVNKSNHFGRQALCFPGHLGVHCIGVSSGVFVSRHPVPIPLHIHTP